MEAQEITEAKQAATQDSRLYSLFFTYAEALAYLQAGAGTMPKDEVLARLSDRFVIDVKAITQTKENN
jgi:hypothetical protein